MILIVEDKDFSTVGLPAGSYDLDDLRAVRDVKITGGGLGLHDNIAIDIQLHSGMTPEPGSTGSPHFKFGVEVTDELTLRGKKVTIFGRPEPAGGTAYGYSEIIGDDVLSQPRRNAAEQRIKSGVDAVALELVRALIRCAVEKVFKVAKPQCLPAGESQDAFFGLPAKKKSNACAECGGSGVWMNPANGKESACSSGCKQP